jgi:hypothetical protein
MSSVTDRKRFSRQQDTEIAVQPAAKSLAPRSCARPLRTPALMRQVSLPNFFGSFYLTKAAKDPKLKRHRPENLAQDQE